MDEYETVNEELIILMRRMRTETDPKKVEILNGLIEKKITKMQSMIGDKRWKHK